MPVFGRGVQSLWVGVFFQKNQGLPHRGLYDEDPDAARRIKTTHVWLLYWASECSSQLLGGLRLESRISYIKAQRTEVSWNPGALGTGRGGSAKTLKSLKTYEIMAWHFNTVRGLEF